MNQDVFLMHFEGRLCQQNSRIPAFVRKLFVYFVIRTEIEHKNVKRQVLEPLPANGSLKKSLPVHDMHPADGSLMHAVNRNVSCSWQLATMKRYEVEPRLE